jgi:soluble lytic murein transglycosylase-like protein
MGGGIAPSTGNVMQITATLRGMPDAQLQQYAAMHKSDPFVFPLAFQESKTRQQMRAGQAAQMAGQKPPPVVDQDLAQMTPPAPMGLPEDQGIGALNAPNLQNMADGGIAGYADGGPSQPGMFNYAQMAPAVDLHPNSGVTSQNMASGGIAGYAAGGAPDYSPDVYRRYAIQKAREMGVPPELADSIFRIESGYKPEAKSKTGPVGIGQLAAKTAKGYGLNPNERTDGFKNIDASLAFIKDLQGKYNGDPQKVAVAYNQGEPFLNKHLKENEGTLVPEKLNKPEANNYLKKLGSFLPISAAHAETVPGREATAPTQAPVKAVDQIPGVNPVIAREQAAKAAAAPQTITGNQGLIGAGETALQYGTGLLSIPTAGIAALGNKIFNGVPMEDTFKRLSNEVTYSPRTEGGKAVSQAFGKNLEDLKIPPYLAHIGLGESIKRPSGGIAETEAAMQQAIERGKRTTLTPEGTTQQRLEMARPNEPIVVDSQGTAIPASRRQNMINAINDEKGIPANAAEVGTWKKANETAKEVEAARAVSAENRGEASRMQGVASTLGVVPQIAATANAPATEPQYPNENGPEDRWNMPAPTPTTTDKTEAVKQTEEPKQGRDWNDMLLHLGLGLMAGQSPHALQNLGTAGLGALKHEQEMKRMTLEERKEAALEALQKQQGQYYGAQAGYLEDLRGPQAALASADRNFTEWQKNPLHLNATPEQARTAYQTFIQDAYKNLGIIHPSRISEQAKTDFSKYFSPQ